MDIIYRYLYNIITLLNPFSFVFIFRVIFPYINNFFFFKRPPLLLFVVTLYIILDADTCVCVCACVLECVFVTTPIPTHVYFLSQTQFLSYIYACHYNIYMYSGNRLRRLQFAFNAQLFTNNILLLLFHDLQSSTVFVPATI